MQVGFWGSTLAGLFALMAVEHKVPKWLNQKECGIEKGSKILCRAQFGCAALMVCAGVGVQAAVDHYYPETNFFSYFTARSAERPKTTLSSSNILKTASAPKP